MLQGKLALEDIDCLNENVQAGLSQTFKAGAAASNMGDGE